MRDPESLTPASRLIMDSVRSPKRDPKKFRTPKATALRNFWTTSFYVEKLNTTYIHIYDHESHGTDLEMDRREETNDKMVEVNLRTEEGQEKILANKTEIIIQPPNPARAPSHVFFGLTAVSGVRPKACMKFN